jgi:hypothetical protein
MAKLPDVNSLDMAIPQSGRPIVSYDGTQVGRAAAALGETGMKIGEGLQDRRDALETAYAKSNLLQGLVDAREEATKDQDYRTYGQRFQGFAGKTVSESAAMISNPAARQMFEAEAGLHLRSSLSEVSNRAKEQEKNYGQTSLMEVIDRNAKAAIAAGDEPTRAALIDATHQAIKGAEGRGYITPQQGFKARTEFVQGYAVNRVQMLPPEERVKLLQPLSVRNNNPGNLRGADGNFRNFASAEEGMRAMEGDLRAKVSGNSPAMKGRLGEGYSPTIRNIISVYAPSSENDTAAYIKTVSAESGIAPDVPLTEADVAKIMPAMIKVEGGQSAAQYFAPTGTWVDYIPPDKRLDLLNSAEVQVRQQQAEAIRLEKQRQELLLKAISMNKVVQGIPLDPKDKNDREALNSYFDAAGEQWQQSGPEQFLQNATEFAVQKSMIPDKLQSFIRSGLRGGDANQAVAAADTVRSIRNANPRALDDMPEGDVRLATHMGALVDSGFKPTEAYTRALDAEQNPKASEARSQEFTDFVKKNPSDKFITGQLNTFFTDDPNDVPPSMLADFNSAAESEYQRTGNADAARTLALQTIGRVWGNSRVAGENRYMRYAPERYYGRPDKDLQGNADWINEQLVTDLKQNAMEDPQNPISPDNVRITVNPSSGAKPNYFIDIIDANGILRRQMDSKGNFLLWQPDWKTSPEGMKHQLELDKKVEDARRARAVR